MAAELREKEIFLNGDFAQALVNYLVTRPWGQTNDFIVGLKNADTDTQNRKQAAKLSPASSGPKLLDEKIPDGV